MPPVTALVLGGANTLHEDSALALDLFGQAPDLVIASNHAARDEPGQLDHWATMHPDLLPHWIAQRRAAERPEAGQLWVPRHRLHKAPEGVRTIESWGGSSGLLCVAVALEVGAERVILAGVPMLKTARHYDDEKHWLEARQYWPAWERQAHLMRGRVKSLSGWTRELLGAPTAEWIRGERD